MKYSDIKNIELFKKILKQKNATKNYVVLKEDEQGRYIEYAFCEGAPHDNRCLSWYDKIQPNAIRRNHHDEESWKTFLNPINEIYELNEFSCGKQNLPLEDESHCSAGHPCQKCVKNGYARHWTYDEPVKCACWKLDRVYVDVLRFSLTLDDI